MYSILFYLSFVNVLLKNWQEGYTKDWLKDNAYLFGIK